MLHLDQDYRAWRYRLRVEPREIAFVRRVLRPGDRAVDIGAHKGAFTYWMRKAVGPTGAVIAFEPQPKLAARLARAVADRRWDNVTVHPRALSSAPGTLSLMVPDGGAPSPGATLESRAARAGDVAVEVEVTTLDAVIAPGAAVRLVKCDVEGHELSVFAGARRVLTEAKPIVLFECEARHGSRMNDVFASLSELGYAGSFFWGDALLPVAQFDAAVRQVPGMRPYANNFVFALPSVLTP